MQAISSVVLGPGQCLNNRKVHQLANRYGQRIFGHWHATAQMPGRPECQMSGPVGAEAVWALENRGIVVGAHQVEDCLFIFFDELTTEARIFCRDPKHHLDG